MHSAICHREMFGCRRSHAWNPCTLAQNNREINTESSILPGAIVLNVMSGNSLDLVKPWWIEMPAGLKKYLIRIEILGIPPFKNCPACF